MHKVRFEEIHEGGIAGQGLHIVSGERAKSYARQKVDAQPHKVLLAVRFWDYAALGHVRGNRRKGCVFLQQLPVPAAASINVGAFNTGKRMRC